MQMMDHKENERIGRSRKGRTRRERRIRRFLCFMAAVLMGTALSVPAFAVPDTAEAQREKREAEEALEEANREAEEAEAGQSAAQDRLDSLNDELVSLISEIELLEADIAEKEEQIQVATVEYEEAKADEERQYEAMKKRINYMDEQGDTEYIDVLLQAKSISDILNRSEYFNAIYEYDRNMLVRYQETKEAVEQYRNQLEEERAEQEVMQLEYEAQQDNLESTIASTRTEIANFDEQLARARQEAAEYVRVIEARNAEIRAAEEAARREEESRRAAEASRAAEEAKRNEAKGPGATQAPKKSSGGTAQGREVADYALQFVGNPYVYGGTSLTNGADCSGFVQSVYKHFGISVPRTSGEQRSAGVGVSYSEAQPGDIICYAGHVGIYIGNGQIVHASSARTGIKVSNATYRSILAVRRVL